MLLEAPAPTNSTTSITTPTSRSWLVAGYVATWRLDSVVVSLLPFMWVTGVQILTLGNTPLCYLPTWDMSVVALDKSICQLHKHKICASYKMFKVRASDDEQFFKRSTMGLHVGNTSHTPKQIGMSLVEK